jgi:DNA-binding response OmpR family regulator
MAKTVLIVDDDPTQRRLLQAVLEKQGHHAQCAEDGEAGLAAAKRGGIDVVMLDMVMPGMDGAATFHALRDIDPELPVLLTTGFTQDNRCEKLLEAGAKGVIHKPYKSQELLRRVREILDRHVWSNT